MPKNEELKDGQNQPANDEQPAPTENVAKPKTDEEKVQEQEQQAAQQFANQHFSK